MKSFIIKYIISPFKAPLLPKKLRENAAAVCISRIIGVLAALLCPLYSFFLVEYVHYGEKEKLSVFLERTETVIFCVAVFYICYIALLLLMKKTWCASLVLAAVSVTFAIINHCKFASTGDFFYPWDLVEQAGNVGELIGFVRLDFSTVTIALMFGAFVFAVAGFISQVEIPLKISARLPVLLIFVLLVSSSVSTPKKVQTLLNKSGLYIEDTSLQQSNYEANGFTGAFVTNILSSNVEKPENYSRDAVEKLLGEYDDVPASEDFASPDIVLVLAESFWDVKLLPEVTFSVNPTSNFDALAEKDGVISGKMYQTGMGGGTVRPEFDILTGMTTDGLPSGAVPWRYVLGETESYFSVLRDAGYETLALHPYLSSFYDRARAYPLIGIENCYFEEDLEKIKGIGCERVSNLGFVSDDTFVSYIEHFLDGGDGAPKFIFGISMENHQTYYNKYSETEVKVTGGGLSDKTRNTVENYATGLLHSDEALARLCRYIDEREKPTVLVFFGDHLPSLGGEDSAYLETGLFSTIYGGSTRAERLVSQATPFIVYSNYEFPCQSGILHEGKDNETSSYNLLNGVFELIGAPRTKYMLFLSDYSAAVPFNNVRLYPDLTDEQKKFAAAHILLTYDRISVGNGYSLTKEK